MKSKKQLSFFDHYTIDRKTPHSDETVLKDKSTNSYVLMKQITIVSKTDFKRMVQTLEGQKGLKNDHLLSLIDYQTRGQIGFEGILCHKLITFHEYSSHNLLQQINARIQQSRQFQQYQVWSILCSIVFGLAYLERENIGHGCVSPLDIYLSTQGVIKVADPSIATSSPFVLAEGYYYSPQILQLFRQQIRQEDIDIFKSDTFSLGMCMLQVCLLSDCSQCYDYEQSIFHTNILKQKFNSLVGVYSRQLLNMIFEMLTFEVNNRPNFIQLQQRLFQIINNQSADVETALNNLTISRDTESFHQLISKNTIQQYNLITAPDEEDDNNEIIKLNDEIDIQKYDIDEEQSDINNTLVNGNFFNSSIAKQSHRQTQKSQNLHNLLYNNSKQEESLDRINQNLENIQKNTDKKDTLEIKQKSKQNKIDQTNNIKENSQITDKQQKIHIEKKQYKQLYTDPDLLKMMRDDVERILNRRTSVHQKPIDYAR